MKVLVIAPHMDDEVLGTGGSIVRHVAQGDHVAVCFVAHRVYDHRFDAARDAEERSCAERARAVLGYQQACYLNLADERLDACVQDVIVPLERVVQDMRPSIVYLPHPGDNHQDHRAVFQAARVVLRPAATPFVHRLLAFEVPSSTEQSPPVGTEPFRPNWWVGIGGQLETKVRALECYHTELRAFPAARSGEGVRTWARFRGMAAHVDAAEAFMLLRERVT